LITVARDLEVPVVLDADGPALTAAVPAGPTLVKPNLDELRRALPDAVDLPDPAGAGLTGTGLTGTGLSGVVAAARRLRERGAGAVVVSLGPDGMVAVTEDGTVLRAAPPAPVAGNPTGAGDAAVAVLARGLAHRTPWPRRLAEAVAASAAAVAAPVAGRLEMRLYDRLRREVAVHDLSTEHPDQPDQPDQPGGD
jgi:tagatose 6-phosphate kinase